MAVNRDNNVLGQERIDAPILRLFDSGARADFDALAGWVLTGKQPLVVRGFTVGTFAAGTPATNLQLDVQDGVVLHYGASASGTVFLVPAGRGLEQLSAVVNARVSGAFLPSSDNYVGLDFRRSPDDSTAATATFYDPDLPGEIQRRVPLGRTVDYQILISPEPFEATPVICPVAIVATNAGNGVTSVLDARNLWGRLGSGGSVPSNVAYWPWPQGRQEVAGSPFAGGDKAITSERDWKLAVMTRIWEVGGGERWSSAVADRNVRFVSGGATFTNGEYFEWDGTNLHWRGSGFLMPNSGGVVNGVADQLTSVPGLTDLANLECVYVDLDYSQNLSGGSALVVAKAPLQSLGASQPPLSRMVVAWRSAANIFTRDSYFPVGQNVMLRVRDAENSTPLTRRVRASLTASPTLNVQPLGTFFVTSGGAWVALVHSAVSTLNLAILSGGLAANSRYYVYASDGGGGTATFTVSATSPDVSDLRYKTGDTDYIFVTTFYTDDTSAVIGFMQEDSEYQYLARTGTGAGVQGNRFLDAQNAMVQTAVSVGSSVPSFATIARITAQYSVIGSAAGGTARLFQAGGSMVWSDYLPAAANALRQEVTVCNTGTLDYLVNAADTNLSLWVAGFVL